MTAPVPVGTRIGQVAARRGGEPAVVVVGTGDTLSWDDLEHRSNQVARALADLGAGPGSCVGVALPSGPEHYLVSIGAWKLGACVMPLRPDAPPAERDALLAVLTPAVLVGTWDAPCPVLDAGALLRAAGAHDGTPLPAVVPRPGRITPSGGSTGAPKLIVDERPWAHVPGEYAASKRRTLGFGYGQRQLVVAALYHTVGFLFSNRGLTEEHTLYLLPRFDPATWLDAVERYRIQFCAMTPTHMQRLMRAPTVERADLSSLEALLHTGSRCPDAVKRFWIDRLGPARVFESYGSTESAGSTTNRGDEWLARPGTVGRATPGVEIRVLDPTGAEVAPGEVGEIHFRTAGPPPFRYLGGHEAARTADGFVSVGDLGHLDADAYLYIDDRRTDMIVTGGVNVYASEVEAVLLAHPQVADAVVIGLPDPEWGSRVHAILVAAERRPADGEVLRYCRERLAGPKVPKTVEWLPALPRSEVGKIRRSDLVAERTKEPAR